MSRSANITVLALSVAFALFLGFWVGYDAGKSAPSIVGTPAAEEATKVAYVVIDGRKIPVFPGSEVEIEIEESSDVGPTVNLYTGRGKSRGPGMFKLNNNPLGAWADSLQWKAPDINLSRGGQILGGEAAFAAKTLASKGHIIIIGIGAIAILIGVVGGIWFDKRALWIAAAGLGLVVIGFLFGAYPWVALLLPLAAIGGAIYWWYDMKKKKDADITLKAVVGAVERSPGKVAEIVKKKIGEVAGSSKEVVKDVITKVKRKVES